MVVDATVGGGGHAKAILDAHAGLRLVGLDRDPAALEAAARNLESHEGRVELRHARFDALGAELDASGITSIAGVLFDLGVSSHQLDVAERGFSFRNDGPLDMRMDPTTGQSGADYVNTVDERELQTSSRTLATSDTPAVSRGDREEPPAPIHRELAEVVADAMPAASRRSPGIRHGGRSRPSGSRSTKSSRSSNRASTRPSRVCGPAVAVLSCRTTPARTES